MSDRLLKAAIAVRDAVHGPQRPVVHTILLAYDELHALDDAIHELSAAVFEAAVCPPCKGGNHSFCHYWERHRWWAPCACQEPDHDGKPRPVAAGQQAAGQEGGSGDGGE